MKKIKTILGIAFAMLILTGCEKNVENEDFSIITTNFASYDYAREITKDADNVTVKMLLSPGAESHAYEPTPQDVINIENSDVFIYVGGESDTWVDNILNDIDSNKTKPIKLMDLVNLLEEEEVEGMEHNHDHEEEHEEEHEHEHEEEHEHEYDEHVWTSPVNSIKITERITEIIKPLDIENSELYEENSKEYIKKLEKIDETFKDVIENADYDTLIFGDRFPFRYFTEEYNLNYYAAFSGCSEATEASASTIAFLIDKVKEENMNVVLKIELTNPNIANAISEATNSKVLELNAAHNISKKDFESGNTLLDIYEDNIKVLKEALYK